jgi:hypothetical protein
MSLSSAGDAGRLKFGARKRTLEDYNGGNETPRNGGDGYFWYGNGGGGFEGGVVGDGGEGWMPSSPQPFVNTRYALAGGMDTPSLAAARDAELGTESYNDVGYRRSLGDVERPTTTQIGLFGEHEGPSLFPMEQDFGREANGRPRYGDSPRTAAWSKTAISVAGAVVGKVWEFCRNSTAIFSGFHAGGGTGYRLNPEDTARNFEVIEEEKHGYNGDGRESTPLPGQYPTEELEFIGDYMDHPTPDNTPPRASKRRQVSYNSNPTPNTENELAKNWVVVPPTMSTPSKSQVRGLARYSMPTSSSSARRSVMANTSRPASRAAFSTAPRVKPHLTSRVSHAGSPALNPARGASYASPRHSPSTSISGSKIPIVATSNARVGSPSRVMAADSPAAKEAARWAALKRKEEREQDESLRRLDRQLKDLIREGKEALGTKIEVEIEDDVKPVTGARKWAF